MEWDRFRHAVTSELARPSDLPPPGRPIIVFVGLIDQWVDLDLMADLAKRLPDAELVLPISLAELDARISAGIDNVHVLGRRPFSELPAYLQASDVALIPFQVNALTLAVNPIKLVWPPQRWCRSGMTFLPELLPFAGAAENDDVANDREEFINAVAHRLAHPFTRASACAFHQGRAYRAGWSATPCWTSSTA